MFMFNGSSNFGDKNVVFIIFCVFKAIFRNTLLRTKEELTILFIQMVHKLSKKGTKPFFK